MGIVVLIQLLWRLGLYAVYGFVAFTVFNAIFSLSQPISSYAAVVVPLLAIIKDFWDFIKPESLISKVSYKFVEHNPFNIILLWGLLTGAYTMAGETLYLIAVGAAGFDVVLDGYFDFHHRAETHVTILQFIIVALLIAGLQTFIGFEALKQMLTAVYGML